jgi:hypothetical protein
VSKSKEIDDMAAKYVAMAGVARILDGASRFSYDWSQSFQDVDCPDDPPCLGRHQEPTGHSKIAIEVWK